MRVVFQDVVHLLLIFAIHIKGSPPAVISKKVTDDEATNCSLEAEE